MRLEISKNTNKVDFDPPTQKKTWFAIDSTILQKVLNFIVALILCINKTQRQLCKRLAGPFIPFSWSCLVWKRVLLWIWSLAGSQQPFFCVLGHFCHGDEQTNEQPGDPRASLPLTSVKRQSFAKRNHFLGVIWIEFQCTDGFAKLRYKYWTAMGGRLFRECTSSTVTTADGNVWKVS